MSRVTFYGFGAYVGQILGLSTCAWWDDDPVGVTKFAPGALVKVDLAANLSAARAGRIAYKDIQCDDHRQDGGLTTIGPLFPTGAMIGACWLTDTYYNSLPYKPPRQPASAPTDAYDYELTSYQYYGGELGDRRFYGFHAEVASVAPSSSLAYVTIWHAGTGKTGGSPAGTWWLDLAAVALPGYPQPGQAGELFLDAATRQTLQLFGPKKPPTMGDLA